MQHLLTGENQYDQEFYDELVQCLESVDPRLLESVNAQWKGFKDYAATGGNPPEDEWKQCPEGYKVCFQKYIWYIFKRLLIILQLVCLYGFETYDNVSLILYIFSGLKSIAPFRNMEKFQFGNLVTMLQTWLIIILLQSSVQEKVGQCQTNQVPPSNPFWYQIVADHSNILTKRLYKSISLVILVKSIEKAFASLGVGSCFLHGSNTTVGEYSDVRVNDLFAWIVYQEGMKNLLTDKPSVIYELSLEPR